jgi:dihydroorotate dehydrogenase (NAD+) catalytic subunit
VSGATVLRSTVADREFRNPIVLAAGTAAYGRELADVVALDRVGGFVTKAVSLEPRHGAPAPRVAEFAGGMLNAVGLANPGLRRVCDDHIPWLAAHARGTRKFVNVVGFATDEFARVVVGLEEVTAGERAGAVDGYELNVSCPNTKAGGMEFGADESALSSVVRSVRAVTRRPVFVKLSPTLSNIGRAAAVAVDAGADGITVVNTMPGLLVDVERRVPELGFGTGGMSGAALLPVGVLAAWRVSRAVPVPVMGLGGVSSATDALQYILAGASLVGMGTAALRDPAAPARVARDLERWCARHDVARLMDLRGTLQWQ